MLLVIEKLEYLKSELKTWDRVCQAVGVHRSYIWDIFCGRRDAGPKVFKALFIEKKQELVDLDPERLELAKLARMHKP